MSRRTERVGSTIQQELAQIILRELNDPRLTGLPSITRVKVSPDLSVADVYITVMGTPGQQSAALNALRHSAGLMRTRLTKSLTLRQAPFLKFHIDENLKKEIAVLELLRKAAEETAENDRRRAEAGGAGTRAVPADAVQPDAVPSGAVPPDAAPAEAAGTEAAPPEVSAPQPHVSHLPPAVPGSAEGAAGQT